MIEMKLSQGAKSGHGGVSPAGKVTEEIAAARGVPVGVDCVSPATHSAFSTPLEMLAFIEKLRERVGRKLWGAALDLAGVSSEVTLIEFGEQLRADAMLVERVNALKNVKVITSAKTVKLTGDGVKLNGLVYGNRATAERVTVPLKEVFVQIGLASIPNS